MNELTSRQRMLRALDYRDRKVDHTPCCFMSFTALRKRYGSDRYEVVKAQRGMGLDAMLFIPTASRAERPQHPDLRGLPVRFDPQVRVNERREQTRDARTGEAPGTPIIHKEYITPGGRLTTSVRMSTGWPHGDHIPFVDDYQIPRLIKPLITEPNELDALQYLFTPPRKRDVATFRKEARRAHAFVQAQNVLLAGGWGVGLDIANWLCGMQNLMFATADRTGFVIDLLEMIHRWNTQRMQVVLSAPVDLYIRRAWYEGCDFVTPQFYRHAVLPRLKAEVDLAHEHGARFGYICSSGIKPLLDAYLEAGVDVLIGIDPIQGTHTDMPDLKDKVGGRICLWGGVSGAVTVEMGIEQEVRSAVRLAIETLGPTGLILSPVDNITVDAPRTWQNVEILIDEWRKRA